MELHLKRLKQQFLILFLLFGKILGDSIDSVLGCTNILKNTVGILGAIIIISIVIIPIIKIAVYCVCFKITALFGETLTDTRCAKLISGLADGYKILLRNFMFCFYNVYYRNYNCFKSHK